MPRASSRILPHVVACAALIATILVACDREERRFHERPPGGQQSGSISLTELRPGPTTPVSHTAPPYEENAWAISEGQRLFNWFNCSGCHANGGGGMGPPLIDDKWIYGSDPAQIYSTIVEGRPRGMPSFRGRIPDSEVWKIVAYVRSLGALTPRDARPSRSDDMMNSKPPSRAPTNKPGQRALPPGDGQ
jgi:cytochrome c oxidase cbb3-type subunit 3